ncbi:MAG: cupin domain-containing protein [bacterium]
MEGTVLDFHPVVRQVIVVTPASVETDGEVSRVEVTLDGHEVGPPAHIHPGQKEFYNVIEGELTVKLGRERRVLGPGDDIEVPVGAVHTFANRSDVPVKFIAEHRPALRFDQYITKVHAIATGPNGGSRKPTTLLRIIRAESSYPETIRPPVGMPRLVVGGLNTVGRLLGYPAG